MINSAILLGDAIDWASVLDAIVTIFELIAALIIFYGSARAVAEIVASVMRRHTPDYSAIRREYSKKIVLALELHNLALGATDVPRSYSFVRRAK